MIINSAVKVTAFHRPKLNFLLVKSLNGFWSVSEDIPFRAFLSAVQLIMNSVWIVCLMPWKQAKAHPGCQLISHVRFSDQVAQKSAKVSHLRWPMDWTYIACDHSLTGRPNSFRKSFWISDFCGSGMQYYVLSQFNYHKKRRNIHQSGHRGQQMPLSGETRIVRRREWIAQTVSENAATLLFNIKLTNRTDLFDLQSVQEVE